jgi:hypothetical protein
MELLGGQAALAGRFRDYYGAECRLDAAATRSGNRPADAPSTARFQSPHVVIGMAPVTEEPEPLNSRVALLSPSCTGPLYVTIK